jgi:hypothetical protein
MPQGTHSDLTAYLIVLDSQGIQIFLTLKKTDPPTFHSESIDWPPVKEFEDFKHQIDTRGRYMCAMTGTGAIEPADFNFKMNWNVETALVQHLKNIDAIGDNLDIIEVLNSRKSRNTIRTST